MFYDAFGMNAQLKPVSSTVNHPRTLSYSKMMRKWRTRPQMSNIEKSLYSFAFFTYGFAILYYKGGLQKALEGFLNRLTQVDEDGNSSGMAGWNSDTC